ncbi:hypothetical protein GOBAR_DD12875 [Gossypium barbadense]|nr:hypothetical protein GOBAR_DD12875 [Gossypium barbadense]
MKVYEESGCFDPHSLTDCQELMGLPGATPTNCHNSLEDTLNVSSYNHHHHEDASAALDMEPHQHYLLDNTTNNNSHMIPYLTQDLPYDQCSFLPNPSISFETTPGSPSVVYDPLFHLNLPPQPPVFRELLQSLPHGYTVPADDKDAAGIGGLYHDGDNGIIQFTRDISMAGRAKDRDKAGKTTKHFATERERRVHLNDKYQALRTMVPSPTKNDRASIVGDAIDYIKELLGTVRELQLLVDKKRCGQDRSKRLKTEDAASAADAGDVEFKSLGDPDQCYNTSLRSSWLQRKSKDSEVDVRIVDDEVTIKLVQRKKINCLLFVSRLLDELQLDLLHVAGGNIGDYYSFLFNTKIYEGSSVYACAIANKLIDVVDRQYAAAPPTSSTSL